MHSALRHMYPAAPSGWLRQVPSQRSFVDGWMLAEHADADLHPGLNKCGRSLASNGKFLYVATGAHIFKIGTGFAGSVRARVYASLAYGSSPQGSDPSAEAPWLGCIEDFLLLRSRSDTPGVFMAFDMETLDVRGALSQSETDSLVGSLPYALFTRSANTLGVVEQSAAGWRVRVLGLTGEGLERRLKTKETIMISPSSQHVTVAGAGTWAQPDAVNPQVRIPFFFLEPRICEEQLVHVLESQMLVLFCEVEERGAWWIA